MRAAPSRDRKDVTVAHGRAMARSRDAQPLAREQRPLVLDRAVALARRAVSSAAPSAERVELAIAGRGDRAPCAALRTEPSRRRERRTAAPFGAPVRMRGARHRRSLR